MMESPLHCMFCGKEGHAMRDCPFYKKREDKVQGAPPNKKNKNRKNRPNLGDVISVLNLAIL